MEEQISFQKRTLNIENYPFQLLLNTNLIHDTDKSQFNWCWYAELQKFEEENEDEILQNLMVEIIQKIMKIADIKIVGSTCYKNIYEVIFYAKESDTAKIGGEFSEMPYELEDRKDRFLKYHSKRDADWNNVEPYFDIVINN